MKVYCPESWPKIPGIDYSDEISLAAIFPKAGELTYAFFFTEVPVGEIIRLIWMPPFTAINGWSEQPSEIAKSFIVTAMVSRASMSDTRQYRYDFEVLSCEPLLPVLRTIPGDWTLEKCLDTRTVPPTTFLIWEEASWCGIADIHGLKYICASTSAEAHLELLVEEVNGEIFGLFSSHFDPGGEYCFIGRRKLSEHEAVAVEAAMKQAVQLADSHNEYLLD
ncbi:hypothetical protein GTP58_03775 [Duganella sp. CY15W]|uniref:hypothetical protein n=1 Tax=Duganella sp. CY15W TaxID=2692172 RepID=UPI00136D1BCA|nr:hypothetical protein [Duganella sp. CY15W]MYM27435.1 hypothetical protein [Duganella sp. CY15W]